MKHSNTPLTTTATVSVLGYFSIIPIASLSKRILLKSERTQNSANAMRWWCWRWRRRLWNDTDERQRLWCWWWRWRWDGNGNWEINHCGWGNNANLKIETVNMKTTSLLSIKLSLFISTSFLCCAVAIPVCVKISVTAKVND